MRKPTAASYILALSVILPRLSAGQAIPSVNEILDRASAAARFATAGPASSAVSDAPVVTGDFPGGVTPGMERKLSDIWEFIKVLGGAPTGLPAPRIHFSQFDPAKQEPAWTLWQKDWAARNPLIFVDWLCSYSGRAKYPEPKEAGLCAEPGKVLAWLDRHPEARAEFPFPPAFRAFHYDGTDRIQINPYTTYTGVILQGVRLEDIGYGYYVTGHEMLHYVLDQNGVPGPSHHCLYVTPQAPGGKSPMERLADFLIDQRGYSHFLARRLGLGAEVSLNPCGR